MKKYVFFCVVFLFIISSCTSESSEPGKKPDIDAIAIQNKISEIAVGGEHQFEASFSPMEAEAPENYTWKSSNTSIATINSTGLFTAIDEGVVNITMTSVVPRKKSTIELSDEMTITVFPIEIEQILLDKESLEMVDGSTAILTASFLPTDAKPREIEWYSSDSLTVKVINGEVTALKTGYAIITAKVKGSNIEASCWVTVNPIVLSSIYFDTEDPLKWDTLEVEQTRTTQLIFVPDNAENKNVNYTSSNPSIATVDANGVITGVSKGRATIQATPQIGDLIADYRVEVVIVPDLVTVSVEKESFTVGAGSSGVINATLTNHSSQSVFIQRFRLLDQRNDIHKNELIEETLEPSQSHVVKSVQFANAIQPRAVFTIVYEGNVYQCIKSID